MSLGYYEISVCHNEITVREKRDAGSWPRMAERRAPLRLLEEEIRVLRAQMEQLFLEERSLTAPPVVEVSSLLDRKINEYMLQARSRR